MTNHHRAPSLNTDPPGRALMGQGPVGPGLPKPSTGSGAICPLWCHCQRCSQGTQVQPLPSQQHTHTVPSASSSCHTHTHCPLCPQLLSHTHSHRVPSAPAPSAVPGPGAARCRSSTAQERGSLRVSRGGPAGSSSRGGLKASTGPGRRSGSSSGCSAQRCSAGASEDLG